jgi:NTE family protein
MPPTEPVDPFAAGFTLALGGGGARGYAHIGVGRALADAGLHPTRIVGTSMGALIGAGLAAGRTPDQILDTARRLSVYRMVGKRATLALFDPRPLLARLTADIGDPLIEELPVPLGVTAFDLITGRPRLITSGRLGDALEISIAVPLFFPPRRDRDGVWSDAGPWEGIPVSLARGWAPELPVIGVHVDSPKPAFLASPVGARMLRALSGRLGTAVPGQRLTARRYLGLLTARWADPIVNLPPDLRIAPRLGRLNALQFSQVDRAVAIGERDARLALATIGLNHATLRS